MRPSSLSEAIAVSVGASTVAAILPSSTARPSADADSSVMKEVRLLAVSTSFTVVAHDAAGPADSTAGGAGSAVGRSLGTLPG